MGTSYHAAMYAAALLVENGVDAEAYLSREYAVSPPPADGTTLVIAVSHSDLASRYRSLTTPGW